MRSLVGTKLSNDSPSEFGPSGWNAQQAHRDYHLGFQIAEESALYPSHVHELSPAASLQGAIAHCDMPVESGPTKLLPFSQAYLPGYAAWRREDFRRCSRRAMFSS